MEPCRNHLGQSSVFRMSAIPRAMALFALPMAGNAALLGDSWSAVNNGTRPTSSASITVRTYSETGRANAATSAESGAS